MFKSWRQFFGIGKGVLKMLLFVGMATFSISYTARVFLEKSHREVELELPDRILKLTKSLNSAAETIGQIEAEIKQRQELVDQLQHDAETASKVATLNKDQMNAVAQLLRSEIKGDERQNFWTSQGLAFFYAALGVALSELYRLIQRWRARRRLERTE